MRPHLPHGPGTTLEDSSAALKGRLYSPSWELPVRPAGVSSELETACSPCGPCGPPSSLRHRRNRAPRKRGLCATARRKGRALKQAGGSIQLSRPPKSAVQTSTPQASPKAPRRASMRPSMTRRWVAADIPLARSRGLAELQSLATPRPTPPSPYRPARTAPSGVAGPSWPPAPR
jgi:hypothetical protein